MSGPAERWRIAAKVAYEFLGEDAVVLSLKTGSYYRLNSVTASAWKMLGKTGRLEEVADRLLEIYETDRPTLVRDLTELFAQMEEHGLLIREA